MTETQTADAADRTLLKRLEILEHAKVRMLYIELAIEADKSGLAETYRRHMNRAEEERKTHDALKAGLEGGNS